LEKSIDVAKDYQGRALRALQEAYTHLENRFLETSVSTAYYACYYAVYSRLAALGIKAASHKQVGIQFRRHFIKTKKLLPTFSDTWQKLFKWRMEVDYAPVPDINLEKATSLVQQAEEFVTSLLKIED